VSKGKKNKVKSKKIEKAKLPQEEREEDSASVNFGGIPSRDLKKNLGCG